MKIFKLSIFLIMTVLVMAGAVSAAPAWISSITDHREGPFRVAVDASGNLYVTEPSKNLVVIYSSEGKYVKSFSVTWPLGIAVDAAGNIYVGSQTSGKPDFNNSVEIYNSDLVHTGSLGIGKGEVGEPKDVAVGSDGKVYVVDKKNNRVKGYDPAAGSSFSFNGSFTLPTAIAVSNTAGVAGEAYVVDTPYDTAGVHNRIQVFDKSGQFLRSFIFKAGYTFNPMGIAADSAGLLYVIGTLFNSVFVLDPANGAPAAGITEFTDPDNSMRTLLGIVVSKNGLVYVASSGSREGKGRVDVFALDGSVTMAVDPLSLTFIGTQFAGNPDPQTIVIANTGSGTLNWSATTDQAWINLGKQDAVGPKSADGLAVGVNISAFVVGTYKGTITIDSGFGRKQAVGVTLSVVNSPILNISNGWLTFVARKGTAPAAQGISLGVDNWTGPVSWSIASDSPSWLTVSPASGTISAATVTGAVAVSVNTAGVNVGSYSGLLTVNAPGAIGTGSNITVNLTVTSSTKIKVNTNRPEATFSVTGPASYSGNGAAWSVEDVPAGDYTVTFDAVAGYKRPQPQAKSLAGDGEVTFNGNYASWKELAARKNIVVAKGPGVKNDALVKVYKNNGTPVAFDLVALATRFGANVAVGDIDGDGVAELIVGAGDGAANPTTVRVFKNDKTPVLEFTPFGTLNGVRVATADLNGDGRAEIIVSPAGGAENTGKVAVYTLDLAQKKMVATGIDFTAYTYAYGSNIAVADIDGTGKPVIVTAPGFGKQNPALVKLWKLDTAPQVGSWTVTLLKDIALGGAYGATVAAGDIDGDGKDEVIVGTSGDHAMITILWADGSSTGFKAFDKYGVNVAAADLDGDGIAEIIAGQGSSVISQGTSDDGRSAGDGKQGRKKDGKEKEAEYSDADQERGVVRVFSASGALNFVIAPFEGAQDGIDVAVGELGL